jgi:drug/metabolite transporter (DMT)-like permease
MPVMPRRWTDLLAVLTLATLWGLNWPAVRVSLFAFPPWTFRAIGMGSGALFLFFMARLFGQRLLLKRSEMLPVFAAGFFTITAFNLLLAFAQLAAPTSRAVIVTITLPIWTVILARIFLGEQLNRQRVIGLGFGIAGLMSLGWPLIVEGTFSFGLFLALLAGISWAFGTIVIKRFPTSAPPMSIAGWQLAAGALASAAGMLIFEPWVLSQGLPMQNFQPRIWVALTYHIVFSQGFAYLMWYRMLARLPAGTVSLSTLMVPAIGVFSSVIFLGETPSLADFIGLALMTAAACAVALPQRRG